MKKLFVAIFALITLTINAQSVKDTFDSNNWGWTEISAKEGEAVIRDGVMHIVGKDSGGATFFGYTAPSFVETHCFSSLDVSKNFEIKCEAVAKKINDDGCFGVILDYIDDGNFIVFVVGNKYASLLRFHEGRLIGRITNDLKITKKRDSSFDLLIKSSYQKLQFYVNDMLAIEARYIPLKSNGFGFYVFGKQTVDFDNVEFIQ